VQKVISVVVTSGKSCMLKTSLVGVEFGFNLAGILRPSRRGPLGEPRLLAGHLLRCESSNLFDMSGAG